MVIGIDEAGRGPWAGPLVVAAVSLTIPVAGLNDSKLLSPVRRQQLAALIYKSSRSGTGWVSSQEVDQLGLSRCMRIGIDRALGQFDDFAQSPILIDGNINYLHDYPLARCLVDADAVDPNVMAASIIAKVERDAYMENLAADLPGYGFERHKGYGTAAHRAALKLLGPSVQHRQSFRPLRGLV